MSVASSNPVSRALRTRRASSAPRRHPKTGRLASLLAAAALIAQAVPALAVPAVAAAAAPTPTIAVAVDNGTAANGTYTGFTGATQQLTANGKTDWRIWGKSSTSLTGDARRAGGAGISGLTQIIGSPVVSGTALRALGSCCNLTWGVGASTVPFAFDWTDGASGATTGSKVKAGLQHNSGTNPMRGYGFSFTVPATTSLQRLKVWVDAHHGTGKLTATIGSVTKVDAGIVGNENEGRIFTLDFAGDGSANQVMTVSYVLASTGASTNASNVAIHAAALSPAADFTVAAAPSSLTVAQGASAPSTINVAAVGSSTGTVALSAVSSGSGVTPSLSSATYVLGSSPAPVLTVQAAANATPGNYTVTVTGTLGNAVHAATVTVTVPQPDFTISATPDAMTLAGGASGSSTIGIGPVGATTGTVNLSTSVKTSSNVVTPDLTATLPSSFVLGSSPAPVLTLAASADIDPGTYTATVTATLGTVTHTATVTVTVLAPGAVGVPQLTNVYNAPGTTTTIYAGRIAGIPNTRYNIAFSSASTCPNGIFPSAGSTSFGSVAITTDALGNAFFNPNTPAATAPNAIHGTPGAGQPFVAARVSGPAGRTSDFSPCIVNSPDNDTWPRALDITGTTSPAVGTTIDQQGVARWFKLHVVPGGSVTVDLSSLSRDYDVYLFRDISQAYASLTSETDLTKLSAEFAGSGFSGSGFSGSGFSGSGFSGSGFSGSGFSGSGFSGSGFSPDSYSGSGFSGSGFSGSGFSGSGFSGSGFSGSGFSGSGFSGSGFSGSGFSADSFSSAQVYSLVAWSNNVGTSNEHAGANTWTNAGDYYIRVSGKNGAFDLQDPFALSVTVNNGLCLPVNPIGSAPAAIPNSYSTIVLTDTSRFGGADTDGMTTSLDSIGHVVDLADNSRVQQLQQQADANPGCVYAENLVAYAARDIVNAYRAGNTGGGIKDVVIAGDDNIVPFFRYPDTSSIGPELNYFPPVQPTSTSEASLRDNYVLGQDAYGSTRSLSLGAVDFPIPELPVGRLVETPDEISGMVATYLAEPVVTPQSSLVTGYDFISDAATAIQKDFMAGTGADPTSLIEPESSPPSSGWTATDLSNALLGQRNDISFLGGHFSANSALAADFTTVLTTNQVAASQADLTSSIILSIGCHSGYNIVDGQGIQGVTNVLDWPQVFAQKGATSILGTGYQYGDTDYVAYSEQIYAGIADQLRYNSYGDVVDIGDALLRSKLEYLKQNPNLGDLHEKALLEATLYGIPMLGVDMPTGRIAAPDNSGSVDLSSFGAAEPAHTTGLKYADIDPNTTDRAKQTKDLNIDTGGIIKATWYEGAGGKVLTTPGAPILPLFSKGVTSGDPGYVLRGIGFLGGNYTDSSVVPLTGAPGVELQTAHTSFNSPTFYPTQMWTANYFDALSGGQNGEGTTLFMTPAQHRSDNPGADQVTLRLYDDLNLRLFYSNSTDPSSKSAAPSIYGITSDLNGAGDSAISAHVVGDPKADVQQAWVTFTTPTSGKWESFDLVRDGHDPTLWAATHTLPTGTLFIVQAVNGYGLVSQNDNSGAYYPAGSPASTPAPAHVALGGDSDGTFGGNASITATLTSGGNPVPGKLVTVSLGKATQSGTTDGSGQVHVTIPLITAAGGYQVSATFIGDPNTAPASDIKDFDIGKAPATVNLSCPANAPWTGTAVAPCTATVTGEDLNQPLIVDYTGNADVGTAHASATFYGDSAHEADSDSTTFGIVPATQTITFDPLPEKTFGDADFGVSATSDSGLTVTFASSTTGICTVSGSTVHIVSAGTCTITASQAGNANIGPATDVARSFTVGQLGQTITFGPLADKTYGDPDFGVSATSSSALAVTLASSDTSICTVSSGTVHIVKPGTCTITATQGGTTNVSAATPVARSFTIAKKTVSLAYTGALYWSAGTGTTTSVTFTGQVTQAGTNADLTKATVDFLVFKSGNNTSTPDITCSGTVNASGVASCAKVIGLDDWTVVMSIPSTNAYFTAPNADAVVLTVYQTSPAKYAVGAGYVIDPSFNNIPVKVAAAPKNRGYFGFWVNYKSGTTPQGVAVYSFRGTDGNDYVFMTTSWTGGVLAFGTGATASFTNKCSVTVINPATRKTVAGLGGTNFTCRWDVTDASTDKMAMTASTSAGVLYHQVGTPAAQISVGGGNIVIKH